MELEIDLPVVRRKIVVAIDGGGIVPGIVREIVGKLNWIQNTHGSRIECPMIRT